MEQGVIYVAEGLDGKMCGHQHATEHNARNCARELLHRHRTWNAVTVQRVILDGSDDPVTECVLILTRGYATA